MKRDFVFTFSTGQFLRANEFVPCFNPSVATTHSMKLQCSCGARFEFAVTPDMARNPGRFVCASCGLDSSDFINELIRKELAEQAAAGAGEIAEPSVNTAPRLRVSPASAPPSPVAPPPVTAAEAPLPVCSKHPRQQTTERCVVCGKPICPQCLELFGYVCSVRCQTRAANQGTEIPAYAGQRFMVEADRWRKVGKIAAALGAVVAVLVGVWIWYAWFGSVPRPVFAVRFPEMVHSGAAKLAGQGQIVFLRGGSLARYDLKTQKEIWSRELLDQARIERAVDRELKAFAALIEKANNENPDFAPKMPSREKMLAEMLRAAAAALELRVSGQNVWVISPERLTRFDWDNGKPSAEIPRAAGFGRWTETTNELIFTGTGDAGQPTITHVKLASGEVAVEKIGTAIQPDVVATKPDQTPGAGLPVGRAAANDHRALDPEKVATQAQNLPLAGRIALPAVLATAANQERTLAAMNDQTKTKAPGASVSVRHAGRQLIPSPDGPVELSYRLLEEKFVSRKAMKAPPKKSALAGDLTITKTADVANEILNEQQRARGGDEVVDDESRYQVTLHLPGATGAADWTGEVTGSPSVFPLATVNVLTANRSVIVLDKANQKLWSAALTYNLTGGAGESAFGAGPCVERGDWLYVFDEAVLTAFELQTGSARWRLPSVGVVGIFFDDVGNVYVNTTTASPDKIRYSRQIDITDKTSAMIYKLDSRSGKILWNTDAHGFISYLSGKIIYTMQSYDPGDEEEGGGNDLTAILRKPPFFRLRRIDPGSGKPLWEHFQERAPLAVEFDGNTIELVFRKEVQVLRYLSW